MPVREDRIPRRPALAAALLSALAALSTLAFILINGVNVPFADEWWYSGLVKAVASGQVTFGSFWSPNNEHRMLIPRLEFSTLAVLTGWNSKAMMITGWLMAVLAMLLLFSQFKRLYSRSHPILWTVAVGAAAASLFSLVQMENWLWSFQFAFFFIQFTVVASLIILCRTELALWLRILAVATLGAAASFSSAQGLLLWPALIFSLCLTDDPFRKKAIGVFCLLVSAAVTFALYFSGLPRTTELHLRPEQIMEKVQLPFFGFLGLVGNPLAHWISYEHLPHRAWFIGLFITIIFFFLTATVIKRRRLPDAAPWLGLGAYAYSFCLVTTYGRLGMGYTGGFLASRYTTHVSLLLIAIQALILIAIGSEEPSPQPIGRRISRGQVWSAFTAIFAIGALLIIGDLQSFKAGSVEHRDRQLAKSLIPFSSYFDPEVDGMTTGPFYPLCPLRCRPILNIGIRPLSDAGYYQRLDDVSFTSTEPEVNGRYTIGGKIVEARYLGIVERGWKLSGSISLGPKMNPDLVFLRPVGSNAFIAAAALRLADDHREAGNRYQWQLFLSPFILPDPKTPLEMWVYNPQANEFLKIHQDADRWEKTDHPKTSGI
jgi:hypothetical protein